MIPSDLMAQGSQPGHLLSYTATEAAEQTLRQIQTSLDLRWHVTRAVLGLPYKANPDSVPILGPDPKFVCPPANKKVSYSKQGFGYPICAMTLLKGTCPDAMKVQVSSWPAEGYVEGCRMEPQVTVGYTNKRFIELVNRDPTYNNQAKAQLIIGPAQWPINLGLIQLDPGRPPYPWGWKATSMTASCAAGQKPFAELLMNMYVENRLKPAMEVAKKVSFEMTLKLRQEAGKGFTTVSRAKASAVKPTSKFVLRSPSKTVPSSAGQGGIGGWNKLAIALAAGLGVAIVARRLSR